MGLLDKLTAGAERAAKEAEKAFDKGKAKVGELQIEMQMDGAAKKLGYLVFDFYRGRQTDQAQRQKLLDDLSRMEDQLIQARAEAAKARAEAGTAGAAESGAAQEAPPAVPDEPPSTEAPNTEAPSAQTPSPEEAQKPAGPETEETWPQADA
ncbi:MAG TPA: hypothetical protein VJM10_05180 [Candidatus Methylomirabilis sp.]|nr:hypothetical protein [Candidatus Methylomirabilis sp.]